MNDDAVRKLEQIFAPLPPEQQPLFWAAVGIVAERRLAGWQTVSQRDMVRALAAVIAIAINSEREQAP